MAGESWVIEIDRACQAPPKVCALKEINERAIMTLDRSSEFLAALWNNLSNFGRGLSKEHGVSFRRFDRLEIIEP